LNIKSGNPFIPASIQQQMTQLNIPLLQMMKTNQFGDGYPTWRTESFSKNIFWNAGLDGDLFHDFKWKLDYVYDQSSERVANPNNISTAKLAAALDAVTDAATGNVVCATSLTSSASLFPGCQPLNLFGPTRIDRIVLAEDITEGERVREYIVEGMTVGEWKELARGTAIGHKRLQRFDPTTVGAVRLRVLDAAGEPNIKTLGAYKAE